MLTVLILVCSLASVSDLGACTEDNALQVIRDPEAFVSPICQCRFKFPQMCRSKIPQSGEFSVISRAGGDQELHFWVADHGGAATVPGLAR